MKDGAQQQAVKTYFDGIAAKDGSRVPWADSATLRTPLNPAGGESALIRGRTAILESFAGILPAVRRLKTVRYYSGDRGWIVGQAEIALANGKTLYVLDAFRVEKGQIVEQQNHTTHAPLPVDRRLSGLKTPHLPYIFVGQRTRE